jgi:hypothetical protein
VAQSTPNVPAKTPTPAAIAKQTAKKLITILQDDFNYDIISDIIDTMAMIKRAKKIKPLEKHRMLMNYNIILLSYCLPKIKVTETDDGSNSGGKGVIFNIQIGGSGDKDSLKGAGHGVVTKSRAGVSVTIPTKKNSDGSYTVSDD